MSLIPKYETSRALLIGINKFSYASPLEYAVNDAIGLKEVLTSQFGFNKNDITFLNDQKATKINIMHSYMKFCNDGTSENDRLLIFYAGHGITQESRRDKVGFLVPHDGNCDDLATLIRWDEFTRNSELIRAKHMLFIMDACYGGLAVKRTALAGSKRFLKDMLVRPVRQVITAGKADEVVADSGGPKVDHSVFTGHLLEGLEGKAAFSDGVITANGIMSYVYDKVSKDMNSNQTPHFGFLEGDGDFVFVAPQLQIISSDESPEFSDDVLITIPSTFIESQASEHSIAEKVKEYLSDPSQSIHLHDFAMLHLRKYLVESSPENISVASIERGANEYYDRIKKYELLIKDLKVISICVAYWGLPSHIIILQKIISRLTEDIDFTRGLDSLCALRWYPCMVVAYSVGIALISNKNYDSLYSYLNTTTGRVDPNSEHKELIWSLGKVDEKLVNANVFQKIPGHEKYYTPRSEYLFKVLQPDLDDLLFLGKGYEDIFDEFEILLALLHAHLCKEREDLCWGPHGRFAWKKGHRLSFQNPIGIMQKEAKQQGNKWGPIQAGFFNGDILRYQQIASEYFTKIQNCY